MFKFFKKKKLYREEEKECSHDWEFVEWCDYWAVYSHPKITLNPTPMLYVGDKEEAVYYNESKISSVLQAKKKVCLKCGECKDEEKEWRQKQELEIAWQKELREEVLIRKELAKRMWQDKCCN